MTAKVRCALCHQRFDTGTATQRAQDFNRHRCDNTTPVDTGLSTPAMVLILAAGLAALMVCNWLVLIIAQSELFTPVILFALIMLVGVVVYKLTERNPQ